MWELSRTVRSSAELTAAFDQGIDGLLERLQASGSDVAGGFLAALDAFLYQFGSRGPGEWDLAARAWEAYPDVALAAIDRIRLTDDAQSPIARHDQSVAERDRLAADIRAKLAGDDATLALFDAAMHSAGLFLAGRERRKTNCIKVVGEIRMCLFELGRRMVERGLIDRKEQVYMLLASELDEFRHQPERLTETLRGR